MTPERCGLDSLQKPMDLPQGLSDGVGIEPRGKRQDMAWTKAQRWGGSRSMTTYDQLKWKIQTGRLKRKGNEWPCDKDSTSDLLSLSFLSSSPHTPYHPLPSFELTMASGVRETWIPTILLSTCITWESYWTIWASVSLHMNGNKYIYFKKSYIFIIFLLEYNCFTMLC